ncbi:MAG: hypothetical protein Q7S22_01585, partial [Candidatus Micrarchaeota archaeon]|nr:hypothetical protein [Candidatus Micrarchaeota archaeon]
MRMRAFAIVVILIFFISLAFAQLTPQLISDIINRLGCPQCQNLDDYKQSEMFLSDNPDGQDVEATLFYRNVQGQQDRRLGVKNANIMVFGKKTTGFQNPSYALIKTNNNGVATFNAPNTVDCYDYTFIFCHASSGCGLQSCLQGASLTPEQLAVMPSLLVFNPNPQVPADVMPTIAKITKCPAKPKEQFDELPVFCLPI